MCINIVHFALLGAPALSYDDELALPTDSKLLSVLLGLLLLDAEGRSESAQRLGVIGERSKEKLTILRAGRLPIFSRRCAGESIIRASLSGHGGLRVSVSCACGL